MKHPYMILWDEGVIDAHDCLRWALGDDYISAHCTEVADLWNERHKDIFLMDVSDDADEAIRKIGRAYLEYKIRKAG